MDNTGLFSLQEPNYGKVPGVKGSWYKQFGIDDATARRMNLGAVDPAQWKIGPGEELATVESTQRALDPNQVQQVISRQANQQPGYFESLYRQQRSPEQIVGLQGSNIDPLTGKSLATWKNQQDNNLKALGPATQTGLGALSGYGPNAASFEERTAQSQAKAADIDKRNQEAWNWIAQQRANAGQDINTGASEAAKGKIENVLPTLNDEQKKQYLRMQNTANLSPELALKQFQAQNQGLNPEAFNASKQVYGLALPQQAASNVKAIAGDIEGKGQFRTTISDKAEYSPEQGRYKFTGNAPTGVDVVQNKYSSNWLDRLAGGLGGSSLGLMTGGPVGGAFGAYQGAGGPMPVDAKWSQYNPYAAPVEAGLGKFNRWQVGEPQLPGLGEVLGSIMSSGMQSSAKTEAARKAARKSLINGNTSQDGSIYT